MKIAITLTEDKEKVTASTWKDNQEYTMSYEKKEGYLFKKQNLENAIINACKLVFLKGDSLPDFEIIRH